jgi:hypothetical protein
MGGQSVGDFGNVENGLPVFLCEKAPIFHGFPSAKLARFYQDNFSVYLACSIEAFSDLMHFSAVKLERHSHDPYFYQNWFMDDASVFNWQQSRIGSVPLLLSINLNQLLNIGEHIDVLSGNTIPAQYSEPVVEYFQQLNGVGLQTSFVRTIFPSHSADCFANTAWLPIDVARDVVEIKLDPRLSNASAVQLMRHIRSIGFQGSVRRLNAIIAPPSRDGCFLGSGREPYEKAKRSNMIAMAQV